MLSSYTLNLPADALERMAIFYSGRIKAMSDEEAYATAMQGSIPSALRWQEKERLLTIHGAITEELASRLHAEA